MPVGAAFYAALAGLMCAALSLMVIRLRGVTRTSIGGGDDPRMARMIRVFGNFAEYAALVLVLLMLAEMLGLPRIWLHVFGAAFILGRIAHAIGLSRTLKVNIGRAAGMVLTLSTIIGLAISLLVMVLPKIG
jgi:uncharacterized membrane protein YecN with MAPEG domain